MVYKVQYMASGVLERFGSGRVDKDGTVKSAI
jgi:hypothetical protein